LKLLFGLQQGQKPLQVLHSINRHKAFGRASNPQMYLWPCDATLVQYKALQPGKKVLLAAVEAAGQVELVVGEIDQLELR
jgi:hypothetical protein